MIRRFTSKKHIIYINNVRNGVRKVFKVKGASIDALMQAHLSGQAKDIKTEVLISVDEDRTVPHAPKRVDIRKKYHKEWVSPHKE